MVGRMSDEMLSVIEAQGLSNKGSIYIYNSQGRSGHAAAEAQGHVGTCQHVLTKKRKGQHSGSNQTVAEACVRQTTDTGAQAIK